MAPNDLTPCRMAFYFVSTFAIAQTPTKQPALRLSRTKNLHFAKAPFPGFSAKEAILKNLSQSELSVSKFAQQESIKLSTLYSWQKQFKTSGFSVTKAITPDNWSAEEKFATVLETATLSEIEVSEYCRIKGLYPDQIKTWKLACIEGNAIEANKTQKTTISNKADKKRIKELEKELNRKEKALAETAALLVLRKKFNAYWGEDEDK